MNKVILPYHPVPRWFPPRRLVSPDVLPQFLRPRLNRQSHNR